MKYILFFLVLIKSSLVFSQNPTSTQSDESEKKNVLGALLSYNFSGNKKGLSNFTPVIDYGWSKTLIGGSDVKWTLSINPYAAGQINIDDSASYLPGLMLPGVAGLRINNFIRIHLTLQNKRTIGTIF